MIGRLWRGLRNLRRATAVDAEMDEEFRLHVDLRAADLVRAGLPPDEAARRARIEFGSTDRYREAGRASRGLGPLDTLRAHGLDVKLGLRMLVKYPGLSVVGGLGIAVAVAIGAATFATFAIMKAPLPFDQGDRVVAIENWDQRWLDQEYRILRDFWSWRAQLRTVRDLGAFYDLERNLIVDGVIGAPAPVAVMTASGFRLARVPALLGRPLREADESKGAPPVVVIGYEVWRARLGADPGVIGRDVKLGTAVHTVVGVMPEGFGFPMRHGLWIPFQLGASDYGRREGPELRVFGRLAPGATLPQLEAELHAVGARAAADFPDTHARLQPRAMPYTQQLYDDLSGWELPFLFFVVTMLLVVVCVNVAVLVYARTATRAGEIAIRTALGAGRGRIVTQLFAEALVLSLVAAGLGLGVAGIAFHRIGAIMGRLATVPFWIGFRLPPGTVLYVLVLAALGATIMGVVPALGATGRRVRASLQELGGGARMRLGATWTALIVAQVAITVAALPAMVTVGRMAVTYGLTDPGFPAHEYLTVQLRMDGEAPPRTEREQYSQAFSARYRDRQTELMRRLEGAPGVTAVTVTAGAPAMEPSTWITVEGMDSRRRVGTGRVGVGFFDAFDAPIVAGRGFHTGDVGAPVVIVNQSFAALVSGGPVVGRRIRFDPDSTWHEVVGIASDFSNQMEPDMPRAKVFGALAPGDAYPSRIALRIAGGPAVAFGPRLREIAAALDPGLRLRHVLTLEQVMREEQGGWRLAGWGLAALALSVLGLAAAGVYAMMSFAVTQRRREIGIRTALGAHPGRLLGSIFARAFRQLAIGVAAGTAAAALLDRVTGGALTGGSGVALLLEVAAFMVAVGLLAASGPARRGLRIQPTEALREE